MLVEIGQTGRRHAYGARDARDGEGQPGEPATIHEQILANVPDNGLSVLCVRRLTNQTMLGRDVYARGERSPIGISGTSGGSASR